MWSIGSFAASLPVRTRSTPSAIACASVSHFSARATHRACRRRPLRADDAADRRVPEAGDPDDVIALARQPHPVASHLGRIEPLHVVLERLVDLAKTLRLVLLRFDGQLPDPPDNIGIGVVREREDGDALVAHLLAGCVGHREDALASLDQVKLPAPAPAILAVAQRANDLDP